MSTTTRPTTGSARRTVLAPTSPVNPPAARLVVLIPAYQPDARLAGLVTSIRRELPGARVLIVDDGSGPEYTQSLAAATNAGARVTGYPVNAGKGEALRTGLRQVARLWPQADVVCADADGQHTPADIAAVATRVRQSGHMTLGVRELTGPVPLRSRVGNDLTALLFRGATGWSLRDTQTGLRGYPAGATHWLLDVPGDRYEYELSALLRAHGQGLEVEQVGIETVYEPGNESSHFRPLQDSARIYAPLLKFTGASLASFLIDWVGVLLLHLITGNLLVSVVGARIVSGTANFFMNRHVLQAAPGTLVRTAARYVALALALVAASYLGLRVVTGIGVPLAAAKPVVDCVLYLASYKVQRRFVFRERR